MNIPKARDEMSNMRVRRQRLVSGTALMGLVFHLGSYWKRLETTFVQTQRIADTDSDGEEEIH